MSKVFNRILVNSAAVIALSTVAAFAFDFGDLKTRVIYGLEGPSGARDISNAVVGNVPLAGEGIGSLAGRNLRTRFWTINEQGIVPIHDHANRPAVFTILTGEIYEYTSTAKDRVLHNAGGLALEDGRLAHWWLNEGAETVHLIAFDVYAPSNAANDVTAVPQADGFDLPAAKGVDHALLGVVDIGAHFNDGTGERWVLSTYRTTIAPGGVLPSFAGAGEPLQSFVWQGHVTEHRADGATHLDAHDGSTIAGGQSAYWTNTSDEPAILYFGAVEPASEVAGIRRVGPLAHGTHGE